MKNIFLNPLNKMKPLRGFDFGRNVFSIDMNALTGKVLKRTNAENNAILNRSLRKFENLQSIFFDRKYNKKEGC